MYRAHCVVQEAESLRWIQEHWHEIDPTLSSAKNKGKAAPAKSRKPTAEEVRLRVKGALPPRVVVSS